VEADDKSRILIVDDQSANIKILSNLLGDDYAISVATSGPEAMIVARKVIPDLILLDVIMPEVAGITVCQEMKEDPDLAEIPIIFVTSLDTEANEAAGFAVGASDYITKPINPDIVKARVKVHLQNRQYAQFLQLLLSQKIDQLDQVKVEAAKLKAGFLL